MCNDNSVNYVSECLLSYTDWSGLPFPSPGDLPDPGTELRSPALQADSLPFEPSGKSNIQNHHRLCQIQPHQKNIGQETLCLPGSSEGPSSIGVVLPAGHTTAASCSCWYWLCPQVKGESRCEPPWLKSPMLQRRHPFSEQLHWCDLQGSRNTYSLTSRVILDESLQAVASHQVFISVQFNHQKPFWPQAVCEWLSRVGFFVTPWTVALQALLYVRFSR